MKIISDTHFYHKNILKFEECRLNQMKLENVDLENHDEWLINKWNHLVKPNEEVLHLGDFAWKQVQNLINKLNGNITFIMGNHESNPKSSKWDGSKVLDGIYIEENGYRMKILNSPDLTLLSGLVKTINGIKYLFCHYDIFSEDEHDFSNDRIKARIEYLKKIFIDFNCDKLIHGHLHSKPSTNQKNSINASMEHRLDTLFLELK